MAKTYTGRYCSRYYCDAVRERRCCADCWKRKQRVCHEPCLNDPSRCRLEDITKKEPEKVR